MTREKTYRAPNGDEFTLGSLDRAMDIAVEAGLVKAWRHGDNWVPGSSGTRDYPLYIVALTDGSAFPVANVWHARAFIRGMVTAREALEKQLKERDLALEAERARPHGLTPLLETLYDKYVQSGAFKTVAWDDYYGDEQPRETG